VGKKKKKKKKISSGLAKPPNHIDLPCSPINRGYGSDSL